MDLITGLPIHPLINHGVAVLVPLAAIGALLVIFIPKLRLNYSPLVLVTVLLATVSAFIATQSGEALAERVGLPNAHATQGERLSYVVLAFAILFSIWFALEKSERTRERVANLGKRVLKVVIPITAISSFVLTILVGHSGAQATWKDRIDQTQATALAETGPKPINPAGTINLSNSEIKTHNLKSDCWSIVNGNVYNLTSYVKSHPGGASVIANICGKDGSKAFVNQHNTQGKPNNVLSSFLLGPVGASITAEAGQKVIEPPVAGKGDESDEESDED
ncbi:Cytochrome b5-like Heme/Steroid binding domain-containing protein [Candidatus Nanopelagicus limnes]|uniref:Cytochrome b5-like Heme/Steroid binding domain-containing protein n=1 Tax=Candidatus Nanopelagicus limnae TaxID=1884634 RepID=A0A249JX06_9ACTN|nr:cytochrome b5 domain-containing protein [Candidatus Nanopelagicus limnes]ASY09046.1 Cytochrome b5-like Heme/Steroid binding domain-containing protein [Candidatus Nanopelagicus limnes]